MKNFYSLSGGKGVAPGSFAIEGEGLQRLRNALTERARSTSRTNAREIYELVDEIDASIARNHPNVAATLSELRPKYRNSIILEDLYKVLLPWIPNHPNTTLYTASKLACPRCGSVKYQSRGVEHTLTCSYKRYKCNGCNGWFKGELIKGERVEHRAC